MKRLLWIFCALFISTGVYFTIRYGLRPKPIPVMNPTEFEDPQQIGAVIYKRLRQNIIPERVIVLGSSADLKDYPGVWTGFLKTAIADKIKIDVFYQLDSLQAPESVGGWESVPFTEQMIQSGDFLNQVKIRMQAGHLVVIHGLTTEVSHLMANSLSRQLDSMAHHPVLSLSTLALTLNPDDQAGLQEMCLKPGLDGDGWARMGCAKARVGKAMLRKNMTPGKIWAVIERHGLQEYLIFIHR